MGTPRRQMLFRGSNTTCMAPYSSISHSPLAILTDGGRGDLRQELLAELEGGIWKRGRGRRREGELRDYMQQGSEICECRFRSRPPSPLFVYAEEMQPLFRKKWWMMQGRGRKETNLVRPQDTAHGRQGFMLVVQYITGSHLSPSPPSPQFQ